MLVDTARVNPEVLVLLINQGEDLQRVLSYLTAEGLPDASILLDPGAT